MKNVPPPHPFPFRLGVCRLTIAIGLLSPGLLPAQQPPVTGEKAPSPPLVAALPAKCAWSLSLEKSAEPAATPKPEVSVERRVTKVENTKTGALRRAVVTDSTGETEEYFHINDFTLHLHKATGMGQVIGKSAFVIYEYFSPGLYGMDHLKATDFQGTVSEKGVQCHHYKGTFVRANQAPGGGPERVTYEAWINAETRLPVAYMENDRRIAYVFGPAPGADLALPAPLQTAWNKVQGDLKTMERMRRP